MRRVFGGVAASALLVVTACTTGGTPAPSSVTIAPTLHWPSPSQTSPGGRSSASPTRPRPSGRTPQPPSRTILLSPDRVGALRLGTASPADFTKLLDERLGTPEFEATCGGAAKTARWGVLTVTFAGVPARARAWEVAAADATSDLRLPRGTEWAPELAALTSRDDATVTTSGGDTVVTLADGFRYRFGTDDRRARTVGAGTPVCG